LAATESLKFRGGDLVIRPVRPADRDRVVELTRDVWDGHDYVPRVFDDWVSDSASAFQAIELDGIVVGLQRLRPYAPGLLWYEGLRVASSHRRQGLARHMLQSAIAQAREQGFREIRLATGNPGAAQLFEEDGFVRLQDNRWWKGQRIEGGESPRIPGPGEAEKLWAGIATSPGIDLWGGVTADFQGAQDLGSNELARLAGIGMLRSGPGGRAIVALREPWGNNISLSFVAGNGGALRELLLALRFEADADGLDEVTVAIPRDHPAGEDLRASGYDFANDDDSSYIYTLKL
jgi:GNAT superfamily N-acetyltransferase